MTSTNFAGIVAALQDVLEEQIRQVEQVIQVLDVRIPHITVKDRSDPFHSSSDEEFLDRYRLPKDVIMDTNG